MKPQDLLAIDVFTPCFLENDRAQMKEHLYLHCGSSPHFKAFDDSCALRLAKLKGFQVSPMMLGNYLWGCLGKSEAYMFAQRHVNKDTSFY